MCEQCNEHELEQEQPYYDEDFAFDPIPLYTDNLVETTSFDEEKFQEGLDDISYVCGQITGLINVGVTAVDALNYLVNLDVLKNNIDISKSNKETQIAVAKEQAIQVEKNSL